MNSSWEIKKLGDLCEVITKGTTPTSLGFKFTEEGINFIKVESLTESGEIIPNKVAYISEDCHESLKRSQLKKNDILFSIAGALGRIGIVKDDILPANTNQALAIIRLKKDANVKVDYLAKYFISSDISQAIEKLKGGAAQQNLSLGQLSNLNIPLPDSKEQKRIVASLEKSFAIIEKAISKTERNLENTDEFFESCLKQIFQSGNIGWTQKRLADCFNLKSGDNLTSKNMSINGTIPVYGGNGVAGFHSDYNLTGDNVIVGRVGALCGNVRYVSEKIWLTDNCFKVTDYQVEFDHKFLTYMLNFKKLRSYARQAAQPVISNSSLANVVLNFPASVLTQKKIAQKLDQLSNEINRAKQNYQKKIKVLQELKKSILQKAFNGELKGASQ